MTLEYLHERICEELCDAKEYIKLAIELKSSKPEEAKTFATMSSDELSHATNLFKIYDSRYNEAIKAYSEVPGYMQECRDEVVETYTKKAAKVKYLHELYQR